MFKKWGKSGKSSKDKYSQKDSSSSHQISEEAQHSEYSNTPAVSPPSTPPHRPSYESEYSYTGNWHDAALESRPGSPEEPPTHHNAWTETHPSLDYHVGRSRMYSESQQHYQAEQSPETSPTVSPTLSPIRLDPNAARIRAEYDARRNNLQSYRSRYGDLSSSTYERHRRH
jgi:hypothetical protein